MHGFDRASRAIGAQAPFRVNHIAAAAIQALLDLLVLLVSIVRLVNELRLLLWHPIAMVVQAR